jgi:hypothetical protein
MLEQSNEAVKETEIKNCKNGEAHKIRLVSRQQGDFGFDDSGATYS